MPTNIDRDLTKDMRQLSNHLRAHVVKNIINCWQLLVRFIAHLNANPVTTFGTVVAI